MISENVKGAVLMSVSMAGFVLNDALMKLVGPELGLFQTIFVRGLFTIAFLGALAWSLGAFQAWPGRRDSGLISLRTMAEIAATLLFLTALFNMELANATAILQILPLTMALAAAVFLAEPIGPRRLFAIFLGFVGVLLVIQPGADGFNRYALFALAAVVTVTLRDLTVRKFSPGLSSAFVAFVAAVVITIVGGVGSVVQNTWTALGWAEFRVLIPAAFCMTVAYYCSVAAMRVGDVAVVATYRYTILIWAMGLGYVFFDEVPDVLALFGMVLIAGAGLFMLWRDARPKRG